MGVVMERWCPTQQMLGVFLRRILVKKLLLAGVMLLVVSAAADAQSHFIGAKKIPGDPYVSSGCGSSWAIWRYRAWVRRHTPAEYQARQQRIARNCNPATVWKDACR